MGLRALSGVQPPNSPLGLLLQMVIGMRQTEQLQTLLVALLVVEVVLAGMCAAGECAGAG